MEIEFNSRVITITLAILITGCLELSEAFLAEWQVGLLANKNITLIKLVLITFYVLFLPPVLDLQLLKFPSPFTFTLDLDSLLMDGNLTSYFSFIFLLFLVNFLLLYVTKELIKSASLKEERNFLQKRKKLLCFCFCCLFNY